MRNFIILFVFSIILYTAGVLWVGSIVWGDSLYYMAYTHTFVVDHDLDLSNEATTFPNRIEVNKNTGKVINKFSPGTSVMWIPGFTAGYFLQLVVSFIFNYQVVWLPLYATAISSIAFSVLGLYFVYQTLLFFFDKKVSSLTVFFLYLTTQMFYYTSIDPLNSHSVSFLVSSLLLYLLARNVVKKTLSNYSYFILGLLSGLLVLIRNQDAVIILPIFIYLFFHTKNTLKEKIKHSLVFISTAFVIFSIQLFITLELFGMFGSPYLMRGEQLAWFSPDFIRVLFSMGNGLFFFAPVLLFATLGLILKKKNDVKEVSSEVEIKYSKEYLQLSKVALIVFLLQLYVVASWGAEIIGGPYGSRMFISILPYLMLGLAYILQKIKQLNYGTIFIYTSLVLLFFNNMVQTMMMLKRF